VCQCAEPAKGDFTDTALQAQAYLVDSAGTEIADADPGPVIGRTLYGGNGVVPDIVSVQASLVSAAIDAYVSMYVASHSAAQLPDQLL